MKILILFLLIATAVSLVIGFSLFNTYSIKTYSARAESISGCVTSDNRTGNEYVSVQCLENPATKLTVCNILGTDLMAYNAVGCGSSSNSLHIHPSTSSSGGHGHHGNHHGGGTSPCDIYISPNMTCPSSPSPSGGNSTG